MFGYTIRVSFSERERELGVQALHRESGVQALHRESTPEALRGIFCRGHWGDFAVKCIWNYFLIVTYC